MPTTRLDPQGLQSPAVCLTPAGAPSCAEIGWMTQAQAQLIENAANVAKGLAAITAAIVCHKDVDCEEWLELLNLNYARLVFIESRGGKVENEKREHDQMVDTFCERCPGDCSRADRFDKGTKH